MGTRGIEGFGMQERLFVYRSRIEAPASTVFQWHARSGAFERLSPPWEKVQLIAESGGIAPGGRKEVGMRLGPLKLKWVAQHGESIPGREFTDTQLEGPFARWEHLHRFEPGTPGCTLEDRVQYALPFGVLGDLVARRAVQHRLSSLFAYRHRITQGDLALHQRYSLSVPQKVLVSGASGLVGSALSHFLRAGGHEVTPLIRGSVPASGNAVRWHPLAEETRAQDLEGFGAVVHLAGENIASRRWNSAQKERILRSRVQGTRLLCEALSRLDRPPRVLISASAIGFYGNRGDMLLDEDKPAGSGFLADVSQAWEEATGPAERSGIRVVRLRIGVVLTPAGGALARMLLPFRLGGGGVLGSGKQFMSWIALDDLLGAILHCLATEEVRGAVNAVAPNPVTNREFTRNLSSVLRRPAFLPAPAAALRLALGEMADELLLASLRVIPGRLVSTGYKFLYPDIQSALIHMLGRSKTSLGELNQLQPALRVTTQQGGLTRNRRREKTARHASPLDKPTGPPGSPSQEASGRVREVPSDTSKPPRRCHPAGGGIDCFDPSANRGPGS